MTLILVRKKTIVVEDQLIAFYKFYMELEFFLTARGIGALVRALARITKKKTKRLLAVYNGIRIITGLLSLDIYQ